MCCSNYAFLIINDDKILIAETPTFENKKIIEKTLKKLFSWSERIKIKKSRIEICQKYIHVQFDDMIAKLKKEHDWGKYPICLLEVLNDQVIAQWLTETGTESCTVRSSKVTLIPGSPGLIEYAKKRAEEEIRKNLNLRPV